MIEGARPFPQTRTSVAASGKVRILTSFAAAGLAGLLAWLAYLVHLNLSSAGSLELLLVVICALRWGFPEATAASLVATAGLNFLFTPPVFKLTVAEPENWVSLATFEITALIVSRLSTRVRLHAIKAETQRASTIKLYELSRAILLIDGRSGVQQQLCALIREIMQVKDVHLTLLPTRAATSHTLLPTSPTQESRTALNDTTDYVGNVAVRTLRIGTTAIGTLTLSGWENDASLADAIASLSAIAVERARAVQEESRAESERDTERLRTAVLDGLAHGFKTPLTAIQTASSGLLAIGDINPTQTELITIVDEQATLLNTLTTKLLKTASLESRQVHLRKTEQSLGELLERALDACEPSVRLRVEFNVPKTFRSCRVDAELVTLALTQLIDNAARYSDIGTPVLITLVQDQEDAIVMVENTGTPIRPEEQNRIFERFYRGSNATGGPSGTGLGLSIVSKAAAAHQGRVSVQVDGKTTRFFFTVPIKG